MGIKEYYLFAYSMIMLDKNIHNMMQTFIMIEGE